MYFSFINLNWVGFIIFVFVLETYNFNNYVINLYVKIYILIYIILLESKYLSL